MAKKEQLQTRPEQTLDQYGPAPDFIEEGTQGLEDIGGDDIILPRLCICQSMSPQRQKGDPLFIKGLEEGHVFNNVTGVNHGEGPLTVLPLMFRKSRILFEPLDSGGGILCQSFNGKDGGSVSPSCATCPKSQWGKTADKQDDKPECTELFNYPVILLPSMEMAVLSMKSASLKAAKGWNSMLRMNGRAAYSRTYEVQAVQQKNTKGTFYVFNVKPANWASKEAYEQARTIYQALSVATVKVDERGGADQDASASSM